MRLFPLVLAVGVLLALPASGLAAAKPARVGIPATPVPVGVSDQNASTFTSPLFAPLGMKYARYVTPWNAVLTPDAYPAQALDKWITAAQDAGVEPLVSFEHPATDQCPHSPCGLPSSSAYRAAFRAFRAKYPTVTTISPWNEANHMSQPTYKKPAAAARYFHIVKAECPQCTVVAADVLDMTNMQRWLQGFVKAAPDARLYGMHNYGDANRFHTTGIQTYLKTVKGSLWLTETGAITGFTTTAGKVSFKHSDSRAAKAMGYLFGTLVPLSSRIKRVYVYNWGTDPSNRWDSGLLDARGKPRKVYSIVKQYIAGLTPVAAAAKKRR